MNVSASDRPARAPRRGARMTAVVCAAVAVTAVAALPGGTSSARALDPPDPVVVVDCSAQARMRPQEYLLACGDGNNNLVDLRWDTWGARTATATGTDMVNDCRPYCAAGRFHAYPVSVTLSDPQVWPAHPDVRRFTTIRLLYTDTSPGPVPKDVTYKLVY
ncbi:hypothetical protein ACFWAR_02535 [Streptomyces sp. NPDC059917]|uniref:hypothetical protein n=1 Tax=Streptomyces sp. NPDC059917 TaxID=3347002 RepID=UPI00364A4881